MSDDLDAQRETDALAARDEARIDRLGAELAAAQDEAASWRIDELLRSIDRYRIERDEARVALEAAEAERDARESPAVGAALAMELSAVRNERDGLRERLEAARAMARSKFDAEFYEGHSREWCQGYVEALEDGVRAALGVEAEPIEVEAAKPDRPLSDAERASYRRLAGADGAHAMNAEIIRLGGREKR